MEIVSERRKMKKRAGMLFIILAAVATAVVLLIVVFFSKRTSVNNDVYSYEGITKESSVADFRKLFPDSEKIGNSSYTYSFKDYDLAKWGCSPGDIKQILGKATFIPSTEFVGRITLSVYPEKASDGKGIDTFKKIESYFTKTLGQADYVNEVDIEYMWTKPDANVAIKYSSGVIEVTYYFNLSK